MYSNNLWQIYSFLPIKKITLSPLGNGILGTFKKNSFMKLDTVIVLVSQRREKYWEQDFFEMPQDGH